MKHLRKFSSVEAMQAAIETAAVDFVGLAYDAQEGTPKVNIAKEVPPDYSKMPFYIDVRGPVTLTATSGLQMSTDGKTWTDTTAMTLPTGKTYFRVASDQTSPLFPAWAQKSDSDYDIGGNINSLVKTSFENDTTCYDFRINTSGFFQGRTKLKSAGNLILPATTLITWCYGNMFNGCSSLTTAPTLPATTLSTLCYQNMFSGCTSLTTAPELPATTVESACYQRMFQNCTALTTAPALPATTMRPTCYSYMFAGCTALTTAPALPATTLAQQCYEYMFDGCTALTTAPALPAATLTQQCYQYMFNGCTKLNYIKCLATNISASDCTNNWVKNVASTGTFVKYSYMSSWTTGVKGIPSGWTTQNATV